MSSLLLDLCAVPAYRQARLYSRCHELLVQEGQRVWIRSFSRWLLAELYREATARPFRLHQVIVEGTGARRLLIEKTARLDFERVLVVTRYRCPGPVVEILAALRLLAREERLELVAFADVLDASRLSGRLGERGYRVERVFDAGGGVFTVRIARGEERA